MPTSIVIVGDLPSTPSGLARIARDVTAQIVDHQAELDLGPVVQAGVVQQLYRAGYHWRDWPVAELRDQDGDWGAADLLALVQQLQPAVVWTLWDPGRCFPLVQALQTLVPRPALWGYFAIDGANVHGRLGGPAAEAVRSYDRVLGYGRWGAEVLRQGLGRPVAYLPHGLDPSWGPTRGITPPMHGWVLGTVAANQPRKDWGLVAATLRALRVRGEDVYGWWHVDQLVTSAWSLPELIEVHGLQKRVRVTTQLSDIQLQQYYSVCGVTLAPGLGEGFGYPIVESLACGVPCVHVDGAGGRELVPTAAWRLPVREWRQDGAYAVQRPILGAEDAANAIQRARRWQATEPQVVAEYCRGAVQHLAWDQLWPRWVSWIRQGLAQQEGW